jgi:hypothetical protein
MNILNKSSQMVSAPILKVPLNKCRTSGMPYKIQGEGFTDGDENELG